MREQDLLRELAAQSRCRSLELDVSDGDLARVCDEIADWMTATGGLWAPGRRWWIGPRSGVSPRSSRRSRRCRAPLRSPADRRGETHDHRERRRGSRDHISALGALRLAAGAKGSTRRWWRRSERLEDPPVGRSMTGDGREALTKPMTAAGTTNRMPTTAIAA